MSLGDNIGSCITVRTKPLKLVENQCRKSERWELVQMPQYTKLRKFLTLETTAGGLVEVRSCLGHLLKLSDHNLH